MNSLNMGIPSHFYIYIALRNKMVKKKQNATFKRNYMNECLTLIIFFFFFWVFFYFLLFLRPRVNHSASTLKRYWKIMLKYHHDCQKSSKSLLYNERSWISKFATCQLTSWDWKILHRTSPAGKIHHSLSSLHKQRKWMHDYISLLQWFHVKMNFL